MPFYRVSGNFRMGSNKAQTFTKEVEAADAKAATESVYSTLGSAHMTPRRWVHVEKVDSIDQKDLKSLRLKAGK